MRVVMTSTHRKFDKRKGSVFTEEIKGERAAAIIHQDDLCFTIPTIRPITPGHTLLIPRLEVETWLDCPPDLWAHLQAVSQTIGHAIQKTYNPKRVGMMLAGMEVPHLHIHILPIWDLEDLAFRNAKESPFAQQLKEAEKIRENL